MYQKTILIGRVGADSRVISNSRAPFITFSIATSKRYRQGDDYKEHTEWHRILFFCSNPSKMSQIFTKGKLVYIEGEISTSRFKNKDNIEVESKSIILKDFGILSSNGKSKESLNKELSNELNPENAKLINEVFNHFEQDELPF